MILFIDKKNNISFALKFHRFLYNQEEYSEE